MSPNEPPVTETALEQELRRDLRLAYEQMTAITSRLLLASETAEAALSGEDRVTIAERFLRTVARGMEVRRAAMFLVEGDEFPVGATFGLPAREGEPFAGNDGDLEACQAAMDSRQIHVVEDHLVADDVREAIAAATAEAGERTDDEDDEDDEAEAGEAPGEAETADDPDEAEEDEADEEDEDAEEGPDEEGPTASFGVYIPVDLEGDVVAVMALGERAGGAVYQNEDLVFIVYLLRQFALTLHRCTLLERDEERLEELDALLKVSREITSTLDLDAVLRSVVNTVGAVVRNDRAEIALTRGHKLVLRAVSGMTRLDPDQVEIFKLATPLDYLRANPRRLHIGAGDLGAEPQPAGHDVFEEYFSAQQMRSFMALPLEDDQGLLGFLCLESRQESWDVDPAEGDTLSILAAQTTVAIRNATLYSEIPLRGVSLPVSRMRSWFGGLTARGRTGAALVAAVAVLGLALPITPERAGGVAEVRPLRFQGVRALTEGVVHSVSVSGGDEVRRGQTLGVIEDLDLSSRLAELRAQLEGARRDMAAARLAGDAPAWRTNEIRIVGLESMLAVEQRRARGRVLTAPFAGQILELDLAQRVGQHLEAGESFCTIAALHRMAVDFEVSEDRIGRVRVGQDVAIKAMSYPTRTFRGRVSEVGWRGRADQAGRSWFTVRAEVDNLDRRLRPGMTGVAKATVGRRPAGELLLAPLLRNLNMRLW
jgi:multidrug efflux pump subunit AcrA (membrane-fusion protein)